MAASQRSFYNGESRSRAREEVKKAPRRVLFNEKPINHSSYSYFLQSNSCYCAPRNFDSDTMMAGEKQESGAEMNEGGKKVDAGSIAAPFRAELRTKVAMLKEAGVGTFRLRPRAISRWRGGTRLIVGQGRLIVGQGRLPVNPPRTPLRTTLLTPSPAPRAAKRT